MSKLQEFAKEWAPAAAVVGVLLWQASGINDRLDGLTAKVDTLAETVHAIDTRLAVVETRLDAVESRLGAVEGRLERMEARLGTVESRLGVVESRMDAGGYARALDRGDILMELLNAPPHELRALASALETAEQREDTP